MPFSIINQWSILIIFIYHCVSKYIQILCHCPGAGRNWCNSSASDITRFHTVAITFELGAVVWQVWGPKEQHARHKSSVVVLRILLKLKTVLFAAGSVGFAWVLLGKQSKYETVEEWMNMNEWHDMTWNDMTWREIYDIFIYIII